MKTVLSILFLACVLATNAQQTQVKAYSLEEMKAGFISQYVKHEPEPLLTDSDEIRFSDQFYAASENNADSIPLAFLKRMKPMQRILAPDPSLRVVKNKVLPPSIYLWIYDKDKESEMLYWMGFRKSKDSIEQVKLEKWICKQFGSIVMNNCTLVPAKWFSGQLKILELPMVYGNTVVASKLYRATVVKGEIKKTESVYGEVKADSSSLIGDINSIRKSMHARSYGLWGYERLHQLALNLFGRDINNVSKLRTVPKGVYSKEYEYDFLFVVDSDLKTHLHVLTPSQLDEDSEKRISELSSAIEAQPAGIFGRYWTLEGQKFPGIYVRGLFDGLKWHFFEYNYDYDR